MLVLLRGLLCGGELRDHPRRDQGLFGMVGAKLGVDLAGGGEVDTTAAVYGQLAGAYYGYSAIRQDLTFFDPLEYL